jgi:hypothetical protein
MSSIEYIHNIRILAVKKMLDGIQDHGVLNPEKDEQFFAVDGMEEAADSYNYSAVLEPQKVLCKYNLSVEDRELLLKMLEDIAAASILLGVRWCEYEAELKKLTEANCGGE